MAALLGMIPASANAGPGVFRWEERDGTTHDVSNPLPGYCYPMWEGAIAGGNYTSTRILLLKNPCSNADPPAAYVDPGRSWRDSGNVYWGFETQ